MPCRISCYPLSRIDRSELLVAITTFVPCCSTKKITDNRDICCKTWPTYLFETLWWNIRPFHKIYHRVMDYKKIIGIKPKDLNVKLTLRIAYFTLTTMVLGKNRLKEYRDRKGMTQEQLADKVAVTRQTIISIENGRYVPSLELALKLALVFRCKVEELFGI